ncbi:SMC-Scp complex subunit ScpB [candidate division LCP-89 bacterium B3_LCP]|uniref:SMC-Scp complex subunit ScpB n=1 Tax=candidate division LCP-89 bacterium B3_LCP TaxID=2012998 RepID=A0A532UZC7_UNCL8|nr:MAG: SMC-Scp complex subunit ScpB [candidate division LCP-89 bacterium B3_LCP]
MNIEERRRILEVLIFANDVPLTYSRAKNVLGDLSPEEFAADVDVLEEQFLQTGCSFGIARIAGGVQFRTDPDYAEWVKKLLTDRLRSRLSGPALETLAIVAYRQPITRGDVEQIRGVDCAGVLGTLMERSLVTVGGRAATPGRPLLYVTTQDFLRYFGLNELDDLPKIRELQGLVEADPHQVKMAFADHSNDQQNAAGEESSGENDSTEENLKEKVKSTE